MTNPSAPPPTSERLRQLTERLTAGAASLLGSDSAPTADSGADDAPPFFTPAGPRDGELLSMFFLWLVVVFVCFSGGGGSLATRRDAGKLLGAALVLSSGLDWARRAE